jgi:DNA-directed RNA polymerase subunit alpha
VGNAFRRVLLSSLPGYAITAVRIEGIQHEYTTIRYMREDVIAFLLNVKAIRLRPVVKTDQPLVLRLDWQGEGDVHAGDIERAAECEVANPDLLLATIDDPAAKLSMEIHVEWGKGFRVADGRQNSGPIGLLPVDALFTPIRKVNFDVEHTRIGQVTDYDRLVLEVWTDQTIDPQAAVREAAQILVDQLALFATLGRAVAPAPQRRALAAPVSDELYSMRIEELRLSSRTLNCLRRGGIEPVGQVLEHSRAELLAIRNFGERSLQELNTRLQAVGIPVQFEEPKPKRKETEEASVERALEAFLGEGALEEKAGGAPLAAYSAGPQEEEEEQPKELPPNVGRTFYPD